MRALITGVNGFVGKHLTQYLLSKNYEIVGLCYSEEFKAKSLLTFECDIRDNDKLTKIIGENPVDEIYHLAGPAFIPHTVTNPRLAYEVIFEGTFNLYEAVRQSGFSPKLLFVGSGDEYGAFENSELPLKESTLLRPITPYGVAKAAADLLSYQYNKLFGMKIVRARPFNHTGPGQSEAFVCSSFARQIVMIEKGIIKPVINVGNLEPARDFCDVRDVVEAYWLLLQKAQPGSVYNICSGKPNSIRWILEALMEQELSHRIEITVDPQKVRFSEFSTIYGHNGLIIEDIGWTPKYNLKTTLVELLNYWRMRV